MDGWMNKSLGMDGETKGVREWVTSQMGVGMVGQKDGR